MIRTRNLVQFSLLVCTWSLWFYSWAAALPERPAEEHATLQLVSEQDAFVPGRELWIGVKFNLENGWHTYWLNPGDSGEAPRIEWHLPGRFQPGPLQWPFPTRLANPPFADYGYEHELLLMSAVSTPPQLDEGHSVKIDAVVRYLVCREVCIPVKKQLELTLPIKNRAAPTATEPLFRTARAELPRPAPKTWRVSARSLKDEFVLDLPIAKSGVTPQFFPLEAEQIENAAPQKVSAKPGGVRLHLMKSKQLTKPISDLKGVLVEEPGKAYLIDVTVTGPLTKARQAPAGN